MVVGTLKDGGDLNIPSETIQRWKLIYTNVNVDQVIHDLSLSNQFSKLTKRAALTLINKTLKELN